MSELEKYQTDNFLRGKVLEMIEYVRYDGSFKKSREYVSKRTSEIFTEVLEAYEKHEEQEKELNLLNK